MLLNACFAASDTKLYFKSYGHPEPWRLGGFEFLKQLQEFADVVRLAAAFNHKPYWSKYFRLHFHQNLRKDERPVFPKFIHYAAHAETLSLFYEALGLHRPDRADPAEALLIEFVKRSGKHLVRFVQKNSEERVL